MADVMVIVSKAVFEKAAGKSPKLGDRLRMDRYVTANKALEPVRAGGKLYLVTVRPPDEKLWLVAVLEDPKFDGTQWIAEACDTPMTDISALRSKIKFESGKGISADKGTLGMSLQTPRTLSAADTKLLDAALGIVKPAAPAAPIGSKGEGIPPAPAPRDANTGERSQRDALLQAVIDDPLSDAPRQVYADAMQARNDPRGEMIVLDLALAGPLAIRKRDELRRRRTELMAAHGKTWFPYNVEYRVAGGFVVEVSASLSKLLKSDVFDNQPVVEVTATDVDDKNASKLLAAPWLPRVRHLVVKGTLGDKQFAALVASPKTQQLTTLNVIGCGIKAAGIRALGNYLPHCRTLVLTKNPLGDDGLAQLKAWAHLPELEVLYLSTCGLTAKGVAAFLDMKLPKLVKLTLSNNALDDAIGDVIAKRAPNLPALHHLELVAARLTLKAVAPLGEAKLAQIRRVDVRKNRIRTADVASMPVFRAGT